jgi:hypothetical protein
MEADLLKDSLDTLLETAAAGRFVVLGLRNRSSDAEKVKKYPQVTTYYDQGDFPRSGSSINGPYKHDVTIKIDIVTACAATVDLSVLEAEGSTAAQLAAALAASIPATEKADVAFDALKSTLWDIIMRPENECLGLDYDPNRWLTHIEKNPPAKMGALALVSGTITMTASVQEVPAGETPVTGKMADCIVTLTADKTGTVLDSALAGTKEGS